jgi:DNA-binding XRE family transcriptional regulator
MDVNLSDFPVSPAGNYLGSLIRQIRCLRGLHKAELAASVGIQCSRLHAIEAGRSTPSYRTIVDIWRVLEVGFYEMEALIETRKSEDRAAREPAPRTPRVHASARDWRG